MTKEEAKKAAMKKFPRDYRYHKTEGDFERVDINERARNEYVEQLLRQDA